MKDNCGQFVVVVTIVVYDDVCMCVYMGQFLQGGKNGRLMSFFF